MSRYCESCGKDHKASFFPSPISSQCATAMLNRVRAPIKSDNELPFVKTIAEVEVLSGLPISRWVGANAKWHIVLSKKLYEFAMSNPDQMRNTKRIAAWIKEEATLAKKNQ